MRSLVIAVTLGAGLVTLIAGCSSPTEPRPSRTPSSQATSEAVTGKCVDDFMLIDAAQIGSKKPATIETACATVSIVGAGATVTLGDIGTLFFEGDSNRVTVASLTKLVFSGSKNTVTHAGPAPEVEDLGTENTITAGPVG